MVCHLHFLVVMRDTAPPRITIQACSAIEGPLYAVQLEDSIGYCYDWSFEATVDDGTHYVLRTHRVEGTVRDDDGYLCPNHQARTQALRFAACVEARGSIDPTLWDVMPDRDVLRALMDSWGVEEAQREKDDILFWEASGCPAQISVRR